MTVILIPTKQDWINLSDAKQSVKLYQTTNKDGKYDGVLLKEKKYYEYLMSQLQVANDNTPEVVAA